MSSFGDWLRHDIQYCRFKNYDLTYAFYSKFPSWGSAEARSTIDYSVVARRLFGLFPLPFTFTFSFCRTSSNKYNVFHCYQSMRSFYVSSFRKHVELEDFLTLIYCCADEYLHLQFCQSISQLFLHFTQYLFKYWHQNFMCCLSRILLFLSCCQCVSNLTPNLVYMWWRNKISWDGWSQFKYLNWECQHKPHLWGWQVGNSRG